MAQYGKLKITTSKLYIILVLCPCIILVLCPCDARLNKKYFDNIIKFINKSNKKRINLEFKIKK